MKSNSKQLDLGIPVPPEQTGCYFTFAQMASSGIWSPEYLSRNTKTTNSQADWCLVFDETSEDLESIVALPWLSLFFGARRFAMQYERNVIVSRKPHKRLSNMEPSERLAAYIGKQVYVTDGRGLFCFELAKFSPECERCQLDLGECYAMALLDQTGMFVIPECLGKAPIEVMDAEDLHKTLQWLQRRIGKDWEYIRPAHTHHYPFMSPGRCMDLIDFSEVDEVRERNKETARSARASMLAGKRCKQECFLHEHCCEKPTGWMKKCCQSQDEEPHGPFSEEEITQSFQRYAKKWGVSRELVSLIALNAGHTWTRLLGHTLTLGRYDPETKGVIFFRENAEQTLFSVKDALRLCKLSYREKGGSYKKPMFCEDPGELLDDDLFYAYLELTQYSELKPYTFLVSTPKYLGIHSCTPVVLGIRWRQYSLSLITHTDNDRGSFRNVRETLTLQAGWRANIPQIFRQELAERNQSAPS